MGKTVPKFLFASMFFSQTVFPRMVNNLFFSHFTTNVAVKKKLQTMVFMVKSWTSSELQSKYFQLIIVNPLSVKKTFICIIELFCGWYCLTLSCFHDVTGSWGAAQELGGGSKQVCHQVSKSFMLLCCGQPWKNKCYSDIWLVTVNFSKLWLVNLISTCVQQYIQAQVPLLWYNINTNNEFFFSLATIPTIFNSQLSSFDLLFFPS